MAASDPRKPFGLADFTRYERGEMSFQEQHQFEKQLMEDPALADAYDGFLSMQRDQHDVSKFSTDLSDLLEKRLQPKRNAFIKPIWTYGIAATIILSLGLFWLVFTREKELTPETAPAAIKVEPKLQEAEVPAISATQDVAIAPNTNARVSKSKPEQQNAIATQAPPNVVTEDLSKLAPAGKTDTLDFDSIGIRLAAAAPLSSAPIVVPATRQPPRAANQQRSLARRSSEDNFVTADAVAEKKTKQAAPSPSAGWEAYNLYLMQNSATAADSGTVAVSFTVRADATLADFKALGDSSLFDRAIALVRTGPAWAPVLSAGKAIDAPALVIVRFYTKK